MERLKDKVTLITGAASGIGLATAKRFAAEGAAVAGLDLAVSPGWSEFESSATATFFEADVTQEAQVEKAIAGVVERFGRIDVMVNGAGVASGGPTLDVTEEEWDRVMDINLKGSFFVAKHVAQRMVAQKAGSIVNIASIEGMDGLSSQVTYGTSKGAVIQMTRNMAADFAEHGVRVNCVCPGAVETPMTDVLNDESLRALKDQMAGYHLMNRFGLPEEIANAILFLASDEASFVTGHPLVVDGGWTAGRLLTI